MARHRLVPTRETVTDVFCRERPPVLTVSPGDTVVVRSLDASGYLARQQYPGDRPPTMFRASRGHCLTGPIAVTGARPGLVLSVRFVSLRPDPWGWTAAVPSDDRLKRRLGMADGPPAWLLWDLDLDEGAGTNDLGHTVALRPGRYVRRCSR
jgi:acetamidase/formamidase